MAPKKNPSTTPQHLLAWGTLNLSVAIAESGSSPTLHIAHPTETGTKGRNDHDSQSFVKEMNMSTSKHLKSYLPAAAVALLMAAASTLPQWAVADDQGADPIAPPGDKGFLAPLVEQATPVTIF